MPIQLTEREAIEFFAKIGRPVPLTQSQIREAGVAAISRAIKVHEIGVKAVRKALRS